MGTYSPLGGGRSPSHRWACLTMRLGLGSSVGVELSWGGKSWLVVIEVDDAEKNREWGKGMIYANGQGMGWLMGSTQGVD